MGWAVAIVLGVLAIAFFWAIISYDSVQVKTPEEQELDDRDQTDWITDWTERQKEKDDG